MQTDEIQRRARAATTEGDISDALQTTAKLLRETKTHFLSRQVFEDAALCEKHARICEQAAARLRERSEAEELLMWFKSDGYYTTIQVQPYGVEFSTPGCDVIKLLRAAKTKGTKP